MSKKIKKKFNQSFDKYCQNLTTTTTCQIRFELFKSVYITFFYIFYNHFFPLLDYNRYLLFFLFSKHLDPDFQPTTTTKKKETNSNKTEKTLD